MTYRWQQVEKLCQEALELKESQRKAFLEEACAGDEELRREVESLLKFDSRGGGFIEAPAMEVAAKMMAQEKPELLVGRQLGSYQILSLLGAGGMGVVYQARDTRLKRRVALKVLPTERVSDPERKRRFIQEARAASALNHPNIITIHDVGSENGIDFIVMEYVSGKTLDQRIPRKGMQLDETLKLAVQMADALAKAHSAGIIHRDLKPTNVMVTDEGLVKVLDFGLAKLTTVENDEGGTRTTQLQTEEGTIVGTVSYMSPEQAEGKKVDARSDIFSFGSVLYQMFTGRLAFHGETKASTLAAILKENPKPPSQVVETLPKEVERLISRCLRKDVQHRFQHMDDLKVALEELKEESDSGALEAAGAAGAAVRGKLWWAGVLAGIAIIVVALGLTGWYWLGRSHQSHVDAPLSAVPLTSYRGLENCPSLSPDGSQVAFEWCQEGQKCHIYVKQVGVEPSFQLTNAAANDRSPAWSPDGRLIAFIRELEGKKWALILVPQRGGPERQLEAWDVSKMEDVLDEPYLAWTPDSKWLAFPYTEAEQRSPSLFLISVETREKRQLTTSSPKVAGDTAPAFSPDSHALTFSRGDWAQSDLYLLPLGEGYRPQGEPQRVDTGNSWNVGAAWTADGREIVFSSGNSIYAALWRMEVAKPGKPVRVGFMSDHAVAPSISGTGKRLACSVQRADSNIWRVDLNGPGRKPGKPVQFISSTKAESDPAYSPNGKRIAFMSEQSGAPEVWICDPDGLNAVQLTSFGGAALNGPKWSPDGQSIAIYRGEERGQVYVVSATGSVPRRLTTPPNADQWPFWSQDGRWLYFSSKRSGQWAIWKMPPQGGEAIRVTRTQEIADVPHESPDGKFLYYYSGWPFSGSVFKIPVEGGEETKVLDSDSVHPNALWTVRQQGIYYFTAPDDRGISVLCLYEFATGKTKEILKPERPVADIGDVAVSPDGRTILYSQYDEAGSDLMLVENFR
jgi:eukaryotic-like serine/threonine-protein kinase